LLTCRLLSILFSIPKKLHRTTHSTLPCFPAPAYLRTLRKIISRLIWLGNAWVFSFRLSRHQSRHSLYLQHHSITLRPQGTVANTGVTAHIS
jgi:hypothetical protein